MVKQTKLGFDKVPGQEQTSDVPLVDIRGNLLRDQKGDLLYTEESSVPRSYFNPRNSTPAVINNKATPSLQQYDGSLPVVEQFPLLSEVSTSLLGIPRANTQQSLLSDVSVYGLDENTWEFLQGPTSSDPAEWRDRINPVFGRRFYPKLRELADQQALAIEAFPVPFTFPYGPNFRSVGRYNASQFTLYLRFVELGNILYDYFVDQGYKNFADQNLLSRTLVYPDGQIFLDNTAETDVVYDNQNTTKTFSAIENWTLAWMDIRDRKFINPITGAIIDPSWINNILTLNELTYTFDDTQPGYGSNVDFYAQITSKEAFRYQPGAISGYTFGLKLNQDPASTSCILEWGAVNSTDHYVFQVKGSQFNIVRRSIVPLSTQALNLMGLTTDDQVIVQSPNPFERETSPSRVTESTTEIFYPLYETVIRSDNFNGDPLNGQGPSGYNISFNEVTMYKIEFSWYGAIGAKFYVYIPVGNGEARWVLIHTLVIENLLEYPSLNNPYMQFRYSMTINDASSLREPLYIYKYGASMYIDGSDDGTNQYNNYSSKVNRSITSANSRPVLGVLPKREIYNSDGIPIKSQKNFYADRLAINASANTRVDILECEGCQNGYGQFYAPGLKNGQRGIVDAFRINNRAEIQYVNPIRKFTQADNNKKIISEGIYCSYVFVNEDDLALENIDLLDVKRRLGAVENEFYNTPVQPTTTYDSSSIIVVNGQERSLVNFEFNARLTGFDDIVAATTPITKKNFIVHFLNPRIFDNEKWFAEFRIGVTNKEPSLEFVDGQNLLKFEGQDLVQDDNLYAEWVPYEPAQNILGREFRENDPRYGEAMDQDPRLDLPQGSNTGICASLNFSLDDLEFIGLQTASTLTTREFGTITGNFLIFIADPQIEFRGSEVGVWNGFKFVGSGITVLSDGAIGFTNEVGQSAFYVELSAPLDLSTSVKDGLESVAFKILKMEARHVRKIKAYSFDDTTFYIWISMRDNAQINNIVVQQYDEVSSGSFVPNWLFASNTNITPVNTVITEEGFDSNGNFVMGGVTSFNATPSNFVEKNRLDSVKIDTECTLPLRPSVLKSSIYVGAGQTEIIDTNYLFGLDRFKMTPGAFNNKSIYFSSIVVDDETLGTVNINLNGKEQ